MDSLPKIMQLLVQYWYVYPIIFIIVFFRSPRGKGIWGEFEINLLIRLFLNKRSYHLIKNVTIPSGQGSTQIDHIVVSRYGIFVVETKNMRGWIFGGENQKTWTQKLNKHTITFQNPLRQNYKHTNALAELIGVDPKKMHSVIVFIGESTFKTPMPDNVTQGMQFIRFVKAQQTEILGQYEVSELVNRIEERRLSPGRKTHKQHVEHLRDVHSNSVKTKRQSSGRAIRTQLLMLFTVLALGAALVFVFIQPDVLKEIPTKLSSAVQKYFTSKQQQSTSSEPKEYEFSADQVKRAMEEVLRQKTDQSDAGKEESAEQSEPRYQFEIELHTGAKIFTDNAEIGNDSVSYTSKNGLIISLNRDEIKTMKKVLIK